MPRRGQALHSSLFSALIALLAVVGGRAYAGDPELYIRGIGTGEMNGYFGRAGERVTGSFSSVQAGGALPTFRTTPDNMRQVYENAGFYSQTAQLYERGVSRPLHMFYPKVDQRIYAVFGPDATKLGPYTGTAWDGQLVRNLSPTSQPIGITYMTNRPAFEGSYSLPRSLNPNLFGAARQAAGAASCRAYVPNHHNAASYLGTAGATAYFGADLIGQSLDAGQAPIDRAFSGALGLTTTSASVSLATIGAWEYAGPAVMRWAPARYGTAQLIAHRVAAGGAGGSSLGLAGTIGVGLGYGGRAIDQYSLGNRASAAVGTAYLAVYDTLAIPFHWYINQPLYGNTRTAAGMVRDGGQDIGW